MEEIFDLIIEPGFPFSYCNKQEGDITCFHANSLDSTITCCAMQGYRTVLHDRRYFFWHSFWRSSAWFVSVMFLLSLNKDL